MEFQGLSEAEVQQRIAAHKDNRAVESSTQSVSEIIKENVFTYFNLIFAVLAVLLAIVRAWRDMFFLLVIFANTAIGIIQELHSKKVLDRLSLLNVPKSQVVRDGVVREIASEELVEDDVVILSAGCQIPADGTVLEGQAMVNESLLTGEADEIKKIEGDTLLSGSFLVSGKVTMQLNKVGAESYINQLTLQATKSKKGEQSEMISALNRLIKGVGIAIIPIGFLLFVQSFFYNEGDLHESVTGMVAAVIGMIPEGLYLLASVAMAVSTARLARGRVLVHDMKCIETLARVNVLCVDKTGTITEPGMQVYSFHALEQSEEVHVRRLLSDFVLSMERDNATMEAMQDYFTEGTGMKASKVSSFSSRTKYSGAVFGDRTYVLGAPEFVLRSRYESCREEIEQYLAQGFRVLVFAGCDGMIPGEPLTGGVEPLALVALSNPIRKGAKETFTYFAEKEVDIKVISGDNPLTVSVVAQEAGIAGAKNYVDASQLREEEDYFQAVEQYTVFGRVKPEQKQKLVRALKARKKTVAMTGDGVNDVLALKDADCSVAMASGADAASHVSQLVLLDSDFTKMPDVVMEGRRVVNNIERTASLYIVKNIFSMLLALFSVILVLDYPLEPPQVSLIGMFTIGAPTFFLALEPNKNPIRGHFLTNVMVKALPAGLTDFLVVGSLVIFCGEFGIDGDCLSTASTVILTLVGFMMLYRTAQPMNRQHAALMAAMVAGWLFCVFFMPDFFAVCGMTRKCAMILVLFAIITEPVLRYLRRGIEWIYKISAKKR